MNEQLQSFARQSLKDGLHKLPDRWQYNFKLMYSHNLEVDIDAVVDNMPDDKLDWAMQQVKNSLRKLAKYGAV